MKAVGHCFFAERSDPLGDLRGANFNATKCLRGHFASHRAMFVEIGVELQQSFPAPEAGNQGSGK